MPISNIRELHNSKPKLRDFARDEFNDGQIATEIGAFFKIRYWNIFLNKLPKNMDKWNMQIYKQIKKIPCIFYGIYCQLNVTWDPLY